ncbi:PROTEIN TRICHOME BIREFRINGENCE-LIKE 24 [Salix viminalis]|uniref:PROTEIN TRICHOME BIREFRINGENCE-LIKE 24 n=1 Tax=Salix viminalis TaxID=40686 RepID=A0A9Q0QBE4_SALVM|nr:PROTEIN TRICHOME BIREFRINGENCE-LIKE 24 [Salix viminalis]
MKLIWRLKSLNKYNNWIFKLAIATLFLGFAFRFFFYQSTSLEPNIETTFADTTELSKEPVSSVGISKPPPVTVDIPKPPLAVDIPKPTSSANTSKDSLPIDLQEPDNETPQKELDAGKCDLFTGDWIPDPSGPMYTNSSCSLIEGHQNCMRNGRTDSGYLFWRWNPRDCQLPPFTAQRFLEVMRNKRWALIGDSISRNHVQSLLCMLSTLPPVISAPFAKLSEESDARIFKGLIVKLLLSKLLKFTMMRSTNQKDGTFPSYNFSITNIWSPFLVKAAIFEDNDGVSTSEVQLQLDKLDTNWTDLYQSLDYMIISTGKWFLKAAIYHDNDTVVGCHICPGKNLTEMGFVFAYEKALRHAMNFIATSKHKGLIFFRTSTPDHFENGEWHSGGNCTKTTPAKEGEIELKDLNRILRSVELAEFEKASAKAAENGVNLKLLDFTNLLLSRPDGHPGTIQAVSSIRAGQRCESSE